jgi:hypothetical protein
MLIRARPEFRDLPFDFVKLLFEHKPRSFGLAFVNGQLKKLEPDH